MYGSKGKSKKTVTKEKIKSKAKKISPKSTKNVFKDKKDRDFPSDTPV